MYFIVVSAGTAIIIITLRHRDLYNADLCRLHAQGDAHSITESNTKTTLVRALSELCVVYMYIREQQAHYSHAAAADCIMDYCVLKVDLMRTCRRRLCSSQHTHWPLDVHMETRTSE